MTETYFDCFFYFTLASFRVIVHIQEWPVLQDFKYTLRLWIARPSSTAFAIAALAIGIGANTGVFSVLNALLLRSLPFRQSERLARIQQIIPPHATAQEFHDWRRQSTYLSDAALIEENDVNLGATGIATRAHVAQTTWNFFDVLGVQPVLGTAFSPDSDVNGTAWGLPGPNASAVVSYGLWQQVFGGTPNVLGATIRMDGIRLTIVGVAPPGFDYPDHSVLWKPAAFSGGNNGWTTIARLRPAISWPQAQAAFALDVERLSPKTAPNDNVLRPSLTPLQEAIAGPAKNASLILMAAVLFVLIIACANVASLLLSRTADRAAELSIRSALGASRARLLHQLLAESLLLCAVATFLGLLIADAITAIAAKIEPPPLGAQAYSIFDQHVLVFTAVISLLITVAFGLLPSVYVVRTDKLRSRSITTSRHSRLLRETLVAAQVTLTMILLASSVCLGRAFIHLMRIDRGYQIKGIVTANVALDGTTHQLENRQLPYFQGVLERLRKLPAVRSASATEFLPLYASAFVGGPFGLDGRPAAHNSTLIPVMAGYFEVMGTQLLCGREFTEAEIRSGAKVAVVNDHFAATFGAPGDVLNHQLTTEGEAPRKIVGVAKAMEFETDPTLAGANQVFVPSLTPGSFFSTFVVSVQGHADDQMATIRDTIQSVDPQVPVFGVKTMRQRLDEVFAAPRFYRAAVWSFAALALLLALIGVYGIVSYAVVERTQEIGIRMALGRTPVRLRSMLLRRALSLVLAGAIPGILGAQLTTRILESLVEGAKPIGMTLSSGLLLLFAVIASVSIWSATRRISTLDVISVLRSE